MLGTSVVNGSRTIPSFVDGSWSMLSKPNGLPYVIRPGLDASLEGDHIDGPTNIAYNIDPPSRLI